MFDKKNIIVILFILFIIIFLFLKFSKYRTKNIVLYKTNNYDVPTIINFNASWCKYSVNFQPTWDLFKIKMNNKSMRVLDIKCDKTENKELCDKNDIKGYPTIKLFTKNKEIVYNSRRTIKDLVKFVRNNITF